MEISIDKNNPYWVVKVGTHFSKDIKEKFKKKIKDNVSTFAWSTANIKGTNPSITTHDEYWLNFQVNQEEKKLGSYRAKAVNGEVNILLVTWSIIEARYPEWLVSPVVVKNKNVKWRICIT